MTQLVQLSRHNCTNCVIQYTRQCSWWWTHNSFETCRARKNGGIKTIYKNLASRWLSTHCNTMHRIYNVELQHISVNHVAIFRDTKYVGFYFTSLKMGAWLTDTGGSSFIYKLILLYLNTFLTLYATCIILLYAYKTTRRTKFLWLDFIFY